MKRFLRQNQRQELLAELSHENNKRYADRIRVILLIDGGETLVDIARFLFLDEGTVRNWRRRYEEGGIEKLVNDHYIGRVALLDEQQLAELSEELASQVFPTTKAVIELVEQRFGVGYTIGGMTSLLHRLGFSYKKPKGVPAKADADSQRQFLRRYRGAKVHGPVYFADSTHPMLNPILASGWIKKGEEFSIKTNSGRQRVNINGAVELASLDIIARTCDTVNQRSICDLLRAIRRKNPDEHNLYLVLDNAPYNRSGAVRKLATQLNIKLLYLPPYSPNLNPIERLWKFMKIKIMANEHYDTIAEFRKALSEFFRGIRKYRSELESLLTDNFSIMQA
ncbi:MAG: IS630 family transposase [Pseudobacteriovorax sp.]|nr:IS630 family transposase [Pseudobacteriovorax sp.]